MVRGEYFFNIDPGYNKGTVISVKPGDIAYDIDIEFPADLPYGFNMLYIRFIDENGVWSQKLPKAIYVDKESDSKITEIEYYFSSLATDLRSKVIEEAKKRGWGLRKPKQHFTKQKSISRPENNLLDNSEFVQLSLF